MPFSFHTVLQAAVPQFAERNSTGTGFAQQGLPLLYLAVYLAKIIQTRRSVGHR
jgi:hypothetical protein